MPTPTSTSQQRSSKLSIHSDVSEQTFAWFTCSLVGLLLANALIAKVAPTWGGLALELTYVLVVSTFIRGWRRDVMLARPAVILLALFCVGMVWRTFDQGKWSEAILLLVMLGFFLLGLVVALRRVLQARTVTSDTILGALAVYLLFALTWAALFQFALLADSTSIENIHANSWFGRFNELVYFSFVTLTTLGYGDILPVGALARFLVYTEATVGQFYIAVLVASLVSKRGQGVRGEF